MTIAPFYRDDLDHFMALAIAEYWVVEVWEFDFLLTTFPQGCFCALDCAGKVIGFVTSLCHDNSGWFGHLPDLEIFEKYQTLKLANISY